LARRVAIGFKVAVFCRVVVGATQLFLVTVGEASTILAAMSVTLIF
jgi:hypothetical protein